MFELPTLPFKRNALEPHISKETIDYHYGKHHQAYVDTLNELIKGTKWEDKSLDDIIKNATGKLFNQAAQHWNHSFYWECLTPNSKKPSTDTEIARAINEAFGSFDSFKNDFTDIATQVFGSGWTWLIVNQKGELGIIGTQNAGNPIVDGLTPLLVCDVWEHAYYIDYRNERAEYVNSFFNIINWETVNEMYTTSKASTQTA